MKDLKNYTSALQDVGLDSTPLRDENGQYHWSNGQLEILNQETYHDILKNQTKVRQIDKSVQALKSEILAYETPVKMLETEGNKLLDVDQDAIKEQELQLDQYKGHLDQLDQDMLVRGYIPPDEDEQPEPEPIKVKPRRVSFKEVIGFLSVWLIGEIFMTYVQWNTLRDGKGIEDMVVRSISLGVVLFLIHLVGRQYNRKKRTIQITFLVFSFLMLFVMLLAPLLIHEAFPPLSEGNPEASTWSLDTNEVFLQAPVNETYPFWVNFYRNNDMLPGILVFLFFVIMQTFGTSERKNKSPKPTSDKKHDKSFFHRSEGRNQIEEKRKYFKYQILKSEKRLKDLSMKQEQVILPNTHRLQQILEELQAKHSRLVDLQHEKDNLYTRIDHMVRSLELQLNRYRTEYMNILNNDQVKSVVVRPAWPNRNDIRNYFNLSA